jgi:hypothetical protein
MSKEGRDNGCVWTLNAYTLLSDIIILKLLPGYRHIKYENLYKRIHHDHNLEARKLVSETIIALPKANVDLLLWKPLIFSVGAQIKTTVS